MLLHTRILSRRCSPWILLFISHLEVTVQNPSKSLFLSQRDWFCNKMQLLHEFRSVRANGGGFAMRKTDGTLWTSADIGVPVKAASTRPITKFPDRKHAVLWWVTRTHSCILQHKYTVCTCDLKSVWTDSGRCDVSLVALQHHAEFSPHNLDCLHWVFRCHVTAPAWINMSAFACAADFGAKFSAEVCSWTSGVAKKTTKKSCKREGGYANIFRRRIKQIFQEENAEVAFEGNVIVTKTITENSEYHLYLQQTGALYQLENISNVSCKQ